MNIQENLDNQNMENEDIDDQNSDNDENEILNNLVINLDDSGDEEFSEDEFSDEDDDLNFPGFSDIFTLFEQDRLIRTLTFVEKQTIFNHVIQGNLIDEPMFNLLKEHILKVRAYSHPSIDIFSIKDIIKKDEPD